jgi:hypothetical protein
MVAIANARFAAAAAAAAASLLLACLSLATPARGCTVTGFKISPATLNAKAGSEAYSDQGVNQHFANIPPEGFAMNVKATFACVDARTDHAHLATPGCVVYGGMRLRLSVVGGQTRCGAAGRLLPEVSRVMSVRRASPSCIGCLCVRHSVSP